MAQTPQTPPPQTAETTEQAGQAARAAARLAPQTHAEARAVWNAIAAHVENLGDVEGTDVKTDNELAVLRAVLGRFDSYVAQVSR